jgi:hypothetical protein
MKTLLLPRPFKVFTKMCVCIVTHTFQKTQANPGQKQKDKANESELVRVRYSGLCMVQKFIGTARLTLGPC